MSDVECKGRMPSGRRCGKILYQSDGEFLYILGLTLNRGLSEQLIQCDNCGYEMHWRRNSEFTGQKIKNDFRFKRQERIRKKIY